MNAAALNSRFRSDNDTFLRIWLAFLNGRIMVAIVLVLQQFVAIGLNIPANPNTLAICLSYLALVFVVRIVTRAVPSPKPGPQWLPTIGVDILVVCLLQLQILHNEAYSYTPLFGLPVLMAAMLGSLIMALATTSIVTILLLTLAWWVGEFTQGDNAQRYLQAALTSIGYFIVAYLVHQLRMKLHNEHLLAQRSRLAAQTQEDVSALVMQHLGEGVLVMDRQNMVRLANPSAMLLLGSSAPRPTPFVLQDSSCWAPLLKLVSQTFASGAPMSSDVDIVQPGQGPMGLRVRSWLTAPPAPAPVSDDAGETLCVIFLHDLREMEARLRTEKLAAMGRMSAAVAHEIRNPLAAIMQANALLEEDLVDPVQQRLSAMVRQNAERLTRITEDVLDIARVRHQIDDAPSAVIPLDGSIKQIWSDWESHDPIKRMAIVRLDSGDTEVNFDPDHLRRVMINLLDNALRYMGPHVDSLNVHTGINHEGHAYLEVWSDGAPLDKSVEQHLFEPFFSSESRSSGLGLYICRELCNRHGASIRYQRISLPLERGPIPGNAFIVTFRKSLMLPGTPSLFDTIMV